MKFNRINTIIDVNCFKVNNNTLIYIDKNNSLLINGIVILKNVVSCNFLLNNFECFTEDRITYIINDNKFITQINGAIITNSIYNNSFLISNYKNGLYEVELYYFIENEFIKKDLFLHKLNFGTNFRLENNFIFQSSSVNIKSLSLLTGESDWEVDLGAYGEIRKVIGVVGDKLWVSLDRRIESLKQATLISIDITTGTVINILNDLPIDAHQIAIIEEKQTILSLRGTISTHQKAISPLIEIDALTGEVIRNGFSQSLYDANFKLGRWQYLNDKIYFDAAVDTINSTHIGIMDYNTLDVIWSTEVKERKAGLTELQVSEDKIYVLDQGGQLFIFEKDEVVNV